MKRDGKDKSLQVICNRCEDETRAFAMEDGTESEDLLYAFQANVYHLLLMQKYLKGEKRQFISPL